MASRSVTCFRNLHYFFFSALWCSSEVSNISILISSLTDRHWVSLSDQCYTKLVTGKGRSSAQSSLFTQRLRPTDTRQTLAFTPHRKCTPSSSWPQSSCEVQACLWETTRRFWLLFTPDWTLWDKNSPGPKHTESTAKWEVPAGSVAKLQVGVIIITKAI